MIDFLFIALLFGYIPVIMVVAHDEIDAWGFLLSVIIAYGILNTAPVLAPITPLLIIIAWVYTLRKVYKKFIRRSSD